MKELWITPEMEKFQGIARRSWKVVNGKATMDIGAVRIGWKIEPGRVLHEATIDAKVTILDEPERNLFNVYILCPAKGLDRKAQMNIVQIAHMIIEKNAVVYYGE